MCVCVREREKEEKENVFIYTLDVKVAVMQWKLSDGVMVRDLWNRNYF